MRARYAVILTHDRPDDYEDCLSAILPQVDFVWVVAHRAAYPVDGPGVGVIHYDAEIPNISYAWNLGLRAADVAAASLGEVYDVAVLNDDAVVSPFWFEGITAHMRSSGAAAGSAAREYDPRMAGYAFILDGTKGLLADEQFEWWYGDDDLQRRAEAAGGVARVWGPSVEHRHPNSTTIGVLAERAAQDRERFERKYGT